MQELGITVDDGFDVAREVWVCTMYLLQEDPRGVARNETIRSEHVTKDAAAHHGMGILSRLHPEGWYESMSERRGGKVTGIDVHKETVIISEPLVIYHNP